MNDSVNRTARGMSAKRLVCCALFAALLAAAAYISIPLPLPGAPHITMVNFVLFIIALLFPMKDSFFITLVWLLLGAVGIPVFIGGKGGFGYLVQPWGAYTWAFPVAAVLLPLIRGKKYRRIWYTVCGIIGVFVIDIIGMLYLMAVSNYDLKTGIAMGLLPFLPLDFLKAAAAAQLIPAFKRVMDMN